MPRSSPSSSTQRTAARWLLFVTIGLIAYASFYPFNWDWERLSTANDGGFPTSLPWGATIRSDIVANLLFYIPLGALLMAVRRSSASGVRAVISTVALGTALSVCMEYLQYATPPRTPSITDVILNCASTAIGAINYVLLQRSAVLPQLRERAFDPALLMLLALWGAFHAAPFMPSLRLRQIYRGLEPLWSFDFSLGGTARFWAGYLLISAALRALVQRQNFWMAFWLVAAASMASRVIVAGQSLAPNEVLGFLLALPVVMALRNTPHRKAAMPLLVLVSVAWFIYALAPFNFETRAHAFNWVPFVGFLDGGMERSYIQFFEKMFLYLGFVWLAVHAGLRVTSAAILGAIIATAIEFAQRYLPGRQAEMTDPFLVLACAALVAVAGTAQHSGPKARPARSARH
jgi:VanZ family protein